jgi:hypothetical protein
VMHRFFVTSSNAQVVLVSFIGSNFELGLRGWLDFGYGRGR